MTIDEFRREFDISYNNILSNAAPGIDDYEKSVFLTKAQESLVTALYAGSFEQNEQSIEGLSKLVKTEIFYTADWFNRDNRVNDPPSSSNDEYSNSGGQIALSEDSKFFKLSSPAMFITYEALIVHKGNCDGENSWVLVKPMKQDEYHRAAKNPFRRPRKNEALRLNTEGLLEIIYPYKDYKYLVRYVRRPKPIILYNANVSESTDNGTTTYSGWEDENLYIDGYNRPQLVDGSPCELDPMLHRTILDSAVALAAAAYKNVNTTS